MAPVAPPFDSNGTSPLPRGRAARRHREHAPGTPRPPRVGRRGAPPNRTSRTTAPEDGRKALCGSASSDQRGAVPGGQRPSCAGVEVGRCVCPTETADDGAHRRFPARIRSEGTTTAGAGRRTRRRRRDGHSGCRSRSLRGGPANTIPNRGMPSISCGYESFETARRAVRRSLVAGEHQTWRLHWSPFCPTAAGHRLVVRYEKAPTNHAWRSVTRPRAARLLTPLAPPPSRSSARRRRQWRSPGVRSG